jgi:hypothetical protein
MMGEIVGMASSLRQQHDGHPRAAYKELLGEWEALMKRGTGT